MGGLSKEQAVEKANKAFVDYYSGSITVDKCYKIVLDPDVRSKLNGWKAPDPWDVMGRPGEAVKDGKKSAGERRRLEGRRQRLGNLL